MRPTGSLEQLEARRMTAGRLFAIWQVAGGGCRGMRRIDLGRQALEKVLEGSTSPRDRVKAAQGVAVLSEPDLQRPHKIGLEWQ